MSYHRCLLRSGCGSENNIVLIALYFSAILLEPIGATRRERLPPRGQTEPHDRVECSTCHYSAELLGKFLAFTHLRSVESLPIERELVLLVQQVIAELMLRDRRERAPVAVDLLQLRFDGIETVSERKTAGTDRNGE